ncbi:MAG: DNA methyltransferase [Anaerolineae bacterium UTCFX2]|jgi:DNA adenine methylase|nr:DNA adenine methylase [Anaerolineae bacterium]MCZ7553152.1 Dam family site-specific DNA-(adenine-N6)-methyltransferase [Anaerolineales bacterium]OQY90170.1 MAG: DNA methyltransferase [Anaerolineae bacterium UTCFX2]
MQTIGKQTSFLDLVPERDVNSTEGLKVFNTQLLKWIGNKQRFAYEIISFFPNRFGTYYEPFLGSGGVLATLAPKKALGSDSFAPLIEIFQTLKNSPDTLKNWYRDRWDAMNKGDKREVYEAVKASFNKNPNAADLLFISRSCYGGVVRFRTDGYISTPVGIHDPISPDTFSQRVDIWHVRTRNSEFMNIDFEEAMMLARSGDVIYCDPPYSFSQSILYGSQNFNLDQLFSVIEDCKSRGVYVLLSIDGTKKSGDRFCDIPIPTGLFEREVFVHIGRSMLKRFQMNGKTLEGEIVKDRLLLTY